ncbi:hypothetical protein ACTXT7_009955 [Hymenolepis weldensis]
MLSNDCPEKLIVIGAGLMRTGTSSLQIALEHLLKRPCYHMSRVALQLREPTICQWLTIYHNNGKGIEETLKGYSATVDYPACAFYAKLLKAHPNPKVILTVRDSKDWVASCRATMFSPEMLRAPTLGRKLVYLQARTFSLLDLHDVMFSRTLGINYADATDEELEFAFQCWNARVRASVPPERLLIFDPANGWEPLCAFLRVKVPSVAFPHANRRIDMQEVLQKQLKRAKIYDIFFFILFIWITLDYI